MQKSGALGVRAAGQAESDLGPVLRGISTGVWPVVSGW